MDDKKEMDIIFRIMFAVFTFGFMVTFYGMLSFFYINTPVAIAIAVIYPIIIYFIYKFFLRFLIKDKVVYQDSDYNSNSQYLSVWNLSYQFTLFVAAVLIANMYIDNNIILSIGWLLLATLTFTVGASVIKNRIASFKLPDILENTLSHRFIVANSFFGGYALLSGLSIVILSFVGNLIS